MNMKNKVTEEEIDEEASDLVMLLGLARQKLDQDVDSFAWNNTDGGGRLDLFARSRSKTRW